MELDKDPIVNMECPADVLGIEFSAILNLKKKQKNKY